MVSSCDYKIAIINELDESFFVDKERITKIIAHRGYWDTKGSCENSLASITKAADIGVDGLECDIWITADDSVVVNHDPTHGGMVIRNNRYSDLAKIFLPNGECFPLFRQYIDVLKKYPDLILFIEIKDPASVDQMIKIIDSADLENETVFMSFNKAVCEWLIKMDPQYKVQLLQGDGNPIMCKSLASKGFFGIAYSLSFYNKTNSIIDDAKKNSLYLSAWTLTNSEQYDWLFDKQFDYAITDIPSMLVNKTKGDMKYWKPVY